MAELRLSQILDEKNISLIYLLSFIAYIAFYYFEKWSDYEIGDSIPITILAVILIIVELILFIVQTVTVITGLKRKTIHKAPAVLILLTPTLILLYLIFMSTVGGGLGRFRIEDFIVLTFHFAVPFSVLYGFAAFAVRSKTVNVKASKIFGVLHALAGAGMTFFYYKIYNTAQAYDYGVPIPDVWYYSPESLLIGYGIWAILGLKAGILLLTNRTNT